MGKKVLCALLLAASVGGFGPADAAAGTYRCRATAHLEFQAEFHGYFLLNGEGTCNALNGDPYHVSLSGENWNPWYAGLHLGRCNGGAGLGFIITRTLTRLADGSQTVSHEWWEFPPFVGSVHPGVNPFVVGGIHYLESSRAFTGEGLWVSSRCPGRVRLVWTSLG